MTKLKIKNSILFIISESFKIYFKYFLQFTKYMAFPVLAQAFAIFFAIEFAIIYNNLYPKYLSSINPNISLIILLILIIPCLVLFVKACWDYLIAYGALNSMTNAIITTSKLYDIPAHNKIITQRTTKFIGLLLIISLLTLIASFPLLWIVGIIAFVYLVLIFQVFALEDNLSIFECFKRSFNLIKGNFAKTFLMMVFWYVFCSLILTHITIRIINLVHLETFFKSIFESWALMIPLEHLNNVLGRNNMALISGLEIATVILMTFITFIINGFTLPLRSICWTLWYKNLSGEK